MCDLVVCWAVAEYPRQAIIGHMFRKVDPKCKEVSAALGFGSRCSTAGLIAKLTGLNRQCVSRQIKDMKQRDFRPKRPTNAGGRKRKDQEMDEELPDLSNCCAESSDNDAMDSEQVLFAGHDDEPGPLCEQGDELPQQHVLVTGCLGDATRNTLLQHWAAAQQVPCPYQGLGSIDVTSRDLVVGLRLASVALRLIVRGGSLDDFASWIHLLDTFFPGEMGELHHSRRFAEDISATALHVVQVHTAHRA